MRGCASSLFLLYPSVFLQLLVQATRAVQQQCFIFGDSEMNTPFPPGILRVQSHTQTSKSAWTLLYNSSISSSNATTPTPRSAPQRPDVANPFISIIDLYGGFDYGGLDQASVTSLQYTTAIFCIATPLLTIIVSTRVERDEIKKRR